MSNYKSVRIKTETYKQMKLIAVELDISFAKLMDLLLEKYRE